MDLAYKDNDLKQPAVDKKTEVEPRIPSSSDFVIEKKEEPLGKQSFLLNLKIQFIIENCYYQTNKTKFSILQHIINVGNQSVDKFPVQIFFKTKKKSKNVGLNLDLKSKQMGASSNLKEESGEPKGESTSTAIIQYCYEVVVGSNQLQNKQVENKRKFKYYTKNLHDLVMKMVPKMQISLNLNKTTQKVVNQMKKMVQSYENSF